MVLINRSKRFYETAVIQIEKEYYDLAVFSLEQSLQLFLKAVLLKLGMDYPRTHSVRKLLEIIYELTNREEIIEFVEKNSIELGALEDAYISSRYIPREYHREEAVRLKKLVDEVMETVYRVIGERS